MVVRPVMGDDFTEVKLPRREVHFDGQSDDSWQPKGSVVRAAAGHTRVQAEDLPPGVEETLARVSVTISWEDWNKNFEVLTCSAAIHCSVAHGPRPRDCPRGLQVTESAEHESTTRPKIA